MAKIEPTTKSLNRLTASEFLIAVNRLQISLMLRDPIGLGAGEGDGLDRDPADHPSILEGGTPEIISNTGRQVLLMVEG